MTKDDFELLKDKRMLEEVDKLKERLAQITANPKSLDADFVQSTFISPIGFLKEKKVGKFAIEREIKRAGEELTLVSHRNWLMMGYKPAVLVLPINRAIHKLKENGKLMMSDTPQEMFLQYDAYKNAKGNVLVGGLGLGMYAFMIAKKKEVTSITVIEKEKDIIKLRNLKHPKIKVIHDDIWKFIRKTKKKFDYAYIDIHYSTGAMEYKDTVLPMRKIFEKRFNGMLVDFWGEEEMKSQYRENY
jgi:hypothetical protein